MISERKKIRSSDWSELSVYTISCNYCATKVTTLEQGYNHMVIIMKAKGWEFVPPQTKDTEKWTQKCPKCITNKESHHANRKTRSIAGSSGEVEGLSAGEI